MIKHLSNLSHIRKRCGAAAFCLVLAFAVFVVGDLTACRKAPLESVPESSSQPSPPPADPIAHPDVLLDGMEGAALYDYAVEQGAVILCNGMATTSGSLPRAFFDGETDQLEVVNFTRFTSGGEEFMRAYSLRFCRTGGGDAIAYNDNELDGWQAEPTYGEEAELAALTLNEYGFLNYAQPFESEASGLRVIHPAELSLDYAVTQALYDEYLAPLYFTALNGAWSSPSELGSWIWIFEDIYHNENGRDPWQEFGENWLVDDMVETLSRYFDGVTAANIIADHRGDYDPAADTIFYEGGRGGLSPTYQVLASQQEGDVLAVLYEERDYLTGAPLPDSCRALRVRLLDDGSFRALSNLPAERPQPLALGGNALA
ncbi:hypothetical protein H8711_12250 [Clostridiaceae bacterium NSJ-31]|uniref:Uncharacterized protein n=1 Tax=Ligaoa zhengdingensis TaxID=2763658 RepID=A0A926DYP8_9FIRM|nr:hypothetical protein [Ligaoa zhengdingensis]MBC8547690.1 hypothetical protein [Ligaoa zhengdingensis]